MTTTPSCSAAARAGSSSPGTWPSQGAELPSFERKWIGGTCPNINCLPTKNEIWTAKVADLVHHAAKFGMVTGASAIDMSRVRQRKRDMVAGLVWR
jgi:pyruvate/2-oxoglutarate dehydrogenase complex dihydrolipoamide dehydrogenase (E3) component